MSCNYRKMYDFSPRTWILPNQSTEFVNYQNSFDDNKIWIQKPSSGRRGIGIKLIKGKVEDLNPSTPTIIQEYVDNPLLIGNYKFDLRIYVLCTSLRPLELLIYNDGLVRFSTSEYDKSNLEDTYAHLTNSSLNKNSAEFNKDKPVIGLGSKWPVSKLWEYLRNLGVKPDKIWKKVCDIAILTILPVISDLEHLNQGFELLGYDVT
eukprot:UN26239